MFVPPDWLNIISSARPASAGRSNIVYGKTVRVGRCQIHRVNQTIGIASSRKTRGD